MLEKKTFWLINQYASTPETGMGGRHYYLAKELAKQGHKVYLIAAGYTHLLRESPALDKNYVIQPISEGFNFVWIKVPQYSDAHDKKRILNWFMFAWKLLSLPQIIPDKPDAILYSSPSLVPYLSAERLAKKFSCRLVWDIRDLWPLTLVELGGISSVHPFIMFNQWIENRACKKSDFITSNWPYAIRHLIKRGAREDNFLWIPNGYNASEFKELESLDGAILEKIPSNKFIIGYTGTLGKANAIDVVLDVALLLKDINDVHFIFVGSGKLKEKIIQFISSNSLYNITLLDPISKKQIPAMLKLFDICYVGFNKSPLYEFGNSLNKLPEYFMSRKPILYSIDSPFKPVDEAHAGITVSAENRPEIVKAILKFKAMSPEERDKLGQNGKSYAIENHDYAKLAQKLAKVLS